jgi:hypothetical protein
MTEEENINDFLSNMIGYGGKGNIRDREYNSFLRFYLKVRDKYTNVLIIIYDPF